MRAIWKGAVTFGLVNVPVRLFAATESHDVSFRQVHATDGGRVRYQRICSVDGEEVPYSEIAKGYETEDGEMVVLTDADFADLPTTSSREISVERFVPAEQIDPMLSEKTYFLQPDASGEKAYALLRQALRESDRVAVVTVALRQRTSMGMLRVHDSPAGEVIVLQTLMWPDEIRTPDFSVDVDQVKPTEVAMANLLVESLAGDFAPEEFTDDYADAVKAMVAAKVEGGEVTRPAPSGDGSGQVLDLMAALQRSVEAAKQARGEVTTEQEPAPDAEEDEAATPKKSGRTGAPKAARKPTAKTTAPNQTSTKTTAKTAKTTKKATGRTTKAANTKKSA